MSVLKLFPPLALRAERSPAIHCMPIWMAKLPFFVHIMEETRRKLVENKIQRSLVLCSSTSAKSLIHQDYFNCCYPPAACQEKVDDLITTILAGRETTQDAVRLMREVRTFCASQSMQGGEPWGMVFGMHRIFCLLSIFKMGRGLQLPSGENVIFIRRH